MKQHNFLVDGFMFSSPKQYEEAVKEFEAIQYIKEKTDLEDSEKVVKLYIKMNEKPSFHTEVGYHFMKELYDRILETGLLPTEALEPVKVVPSSTLRLSQPVEEKRKLSDGTKNGKQLEEYKVKYRNSRIINVFFIVILAVMLVIAFKGDYSYIGDYEEKIKNKYSAWAEELNQREQRVLDKERELGIQSNP